MAQPFTSTSITIPNMADMPQDHEPELTFQKLTKSKHGELKTTQIHIALAIPDYPKSSASGYTYMIPINSEQQIGWKDVISSVQYSAHRQYVNSSTFSPFLNTEVLRSTLNCSGVRICPKTISDLKDLHHYEANKDLWDKIKELRQVARIAGDDITKERAIGLFFAFERLFKRGSSCKHWSESCQPIFKRNTYPNIAGNFKPYISCINATSPEAFLNHFHFSLGGRERDSDINLLEGLYNGTITLDPANCSTFESTASRKKECDFVHGEGRQNLLLQGCAVKFHILIPKNLKECPYVLFTSMGKHTHLPPPPTKAPQLIVKEVQKVIQDINNPDLKLSTFLLSPQLKDLCQKYNTNHIFQIHPSFANNDRIAALIWKEKLTLYPEGQYLEGLKLEQERNPEIKDYVHKIHHTSHSTIIICGVKKQFEIFQNLSTFEVDMGYKRVAANGMKEVVFAAFVEEHGKVMTLLRAFQNREDAQTYKEMFRLAFQTINSVLPDDSKVCFHYLHGSGFKSIVVDMDEGQLHGLGDYLASIDPAGNDALWQIQHIVLFCEVHFKRGIENVIGQNKERTPEWDAMMSLLDCKDEASYDQILILLQGHHNPKMRQWASHKEDRFIKPGLNKNISKMNPAFFKMTRKNTNAGEETQWKGLMFGGKKVSLLRAIISGLVCDLRDNCQYNNQEDLNVRHCQRSTDIVSRFTESFARNERKRRRGSSRSSQRSNTGSLQLELPEEGPIPTIEDLGRSRGFSSSGSPRPRQSQSRGRARSRGGTRSSSSIPSSSPSLRIMATENSTDRHYEQRRRQLELDWAQAQLERFRAVTQMSLQRGIIPPGEGHNQLGASQELVTPKPMLFNPGTIPPPSRGPSIMASPQPVGDQLPYQFSSEHSPFPPPL